MFYFDNGNTITVVFKDGTVGEWSVTNPNYNKIKQLALEQDWIAIEIYHNTNKCLMNNAIEVKDNIAKIKTENTTTNVELDPNNSLVKLIKLLQEKGVVDSRIEYVKPFLKKILENKYINAAVELYDWCTNMDFEITTKGNFLAYKNVNKDLTSKHDNTTKHVIGEYTTVDEFDTDRNKTCSKGLHFCSKKYLSVYGGDTTIIVEIDPRDVVAIPTDYDNQKGRCCRYKTIGILDKGGSLKTINIEKMTNNKTQIVKTKEQKEKDSKLIKDKTPSRIEETVHLMKVHNNAIVVAKFMNICVETVKRNMRKAKANGLV